MNVEGRLDYIDQQLGHETFTAVAADFCQHIRHELSRAFHDRFPSGGHGGQGGGYRLLNGKFDIIDPIHTKNLATGEQRLSVGGFQASGDVYSLGQGSAAEAARRNWPEIENRITLAAENWFRQNVAPLLAGVPAAGTARSLAVSPLTGWNAPRSGFPGFTGSLRGLVPADLRPLLELDPAAKRKR